MRRRAPIHRSPLSFMGKWFVWSNAINNGESSQVTKLIYKQLERSFAVNLYIGNLARDVTDKDLKELFEPFGEVKTINIIKDKFSGQSRGFGFVEMTEKTAGQAAIDGLKGKSLHERTLDITEARPRTERSGGGGGFGGGFGGGRKSGGGRPGMRNKKRF